MNKLELLKLVETMQDTDEVNEVVFKHKEFNENLNFEELFGSNAALKSFCDTKVTKGIETFKTNGMQTLIQAELLKRNPTKTPQELRIEELEKKFEASEKAKARLEMQSKFKDTLNSKKIPTNMLDFVLGEDEVSTNARIAIFEEAMKSYVDTNVKERLGQGYVPPVGGGKVDTITKEQFKKMNLTEQTKLYTENKELYNSLIK